MFSIFSNRYYKFVHRVDVHYIFHVHIASEDMLSCYSFIDGVFRDILYMVVYCVYW